MKETLLKHVDSFQNLCYMMMKTTAGDFAGKYFPKLINDAWDDSKSDEDNLCAVKDAFERDKKLNERFGHPEAAQVIKSISGRMVERESG